MPNIKHIRQIGPAKWAWRYASYQFQKRILRRNIRMQLPSGGRIVLPRSHQGAEIFVTNANTDWGAEERFAKLANPDRDFIDVGAHIGYYACYLSPLVRRVYAFEPDPRNLAALHCNAKQCGNVEVISSAVSSENGTKILSLGNSLSVSTLEKTQGAERIQVRTVTIDSFVSNYPIADIALVKIDVEGHDFPVLLGMQKTVEQYRPVILSESAGTQELIALCRKWNYRIFSYIRDRHTLQTAFKLMDVRSLEKDWYKMLFLVPDSIDF